MRILLAHHNFYNDRISGAMHCMRSMMTWLADAGHDVRVLSSARYDVEKFSGAERCLREVPDNRELVPPSAGFKRYAQVRKLATAGRHCAHYRLGGASVTMLLSQHNHAQQPDRPEFEQLVFLFDEMVGDARPDVVLVYGAHPVVRELMRRAQARGIPTVFTVRSPGFEHPEWYEHVDHVLTPSAHWSQRLRDAVGIDSTAIASPLFAAEILAPKETRGFLTYVNPSLHKGLQIFARLADMLGRERPDIPILVVQSGSDTAVLNSVHGIDLSRYPQIVTTSPVPRPADFLALSKLVLMPSTFEESFGRVAAEAMLNGIPPLVSDRGALPETVANTDLVLPLPAWLGSTSKELVSEDEARPWFERVCQLWDDEDYYAQQSARCLESARDRFSEAVLRRQYLGYFESIAATETASDRYPVGH